MRLLQFQFAGSRRSRNPRNTSGRPSNRTREDAVPSRALPDGPRNSWNLLEGEPVVRTFDVHTYVGQKIAAGKAAQRSYKSRKARFPRAFSFGRTEDP